MQLTRHFTLAEMIPTATGLDNTPTLAIVDNIRQSALLMERVRAVLGDRPVSVSSCYRADAVNRAVGGSNTSAHRWGLAVDFTCPEFGSPRDICEAVIAAGLPFDQLILEFPSAKNKRGGDWVHIGLPVVGDERAQVLSSVRDMAGQVRYPRGLIA